MEDTTSLPTDHELHTAVETATAAIGRTIAAHDALVQRTLVVEFPVEGAEWHRGLTAAYVAIPVCGWAPALARSLVRSATGAT